MVEIPSLETERLSLRGYTIADFDDCLALWSDPDVTRFVGGRPATPEETWSRLLRYVGHWALLGFGYWAVRDRATGRFVGDVGFADFRRDTTPSFEGAPEIGWVLAPWAHGRGLATEAARAAIDWIEGHASVPRTVCLIDRSNAPSIRVAAKCGYVEWARAVYKGADAVLYERRA